jgi:hypothetical protein
MLTAGLAVLLVVLQIPDIWTTNVILAAGGRELNPVVRVMQRRLGRWWWLPKLLLALGGALAFTLIDDELSPWALTALCLVYLLVILSNLRQMARMGRRRKALRP